MTRCLQVAAVLLLIYSCNSSSIKEKINKAGDIAGQATGEFAEGVAKGVNKAFDVQIDLPQSLKDKGISFGKISVTSDSAGTDNLLSVYVIFNNDFNGTLTAKAFDDKGLEMGRVAVPVEGKASEAKFIDFHFDKRTNIDSKNRLTIE